MKVRLVTMNADTKETTHDDDVYITSVPRIGENITLIPEQQYIVRNVVHRIHGGSADITVYAAA
jgi:hypothetical protein